MKYGWMAFKLSDKSKQRREGIDSRLIQINDLALQISKIDFGIPADGGFRTAERQFEIYQAGNSKCDGYTKLSEHQSGNALDFYAFVFGRTSWKPDHLAMVAAAHLQAAAQLGYKLEWGGFWSSNKTTNGIPYGWDMSHIQLVD